jgi:hypothetical protein
MVSQMDLFNAELAGTGTVTDREYARLVALTGKPAGKFSLADLYELAGEIPRLILGEYSPVGPPPPPYEITDNFDRADGPAGAPWAAFAGAINIVSNQAAGSISNTYAYYNDPLIPTNQYSELTASSASVFAMVRVQDLNNFYYARYSDSLSEWQISGRVAGTFQANFATAPATLVFPQRFRLEVVGTTLNLYDSTDALVLSTVHAGISTGKPGIRFQTANTHFADNFAAGEAR